MRESSSAQVLNVTTIEAGLTIPGQLYDWGKCNRTLDHLFADTLELAKAT